MDVFSSETRILRKYLLIFSTIGFAIDQLNLSITKISLFGSELVAVNIIALPNVIGFILIFFLVSFLISSFHEYSIFQKITREANLEKIINGKIYDKTNLNIKQLNLQQQINKINERIKSSPHISEREELQQKLKEMNNTLEGYHELGSFLEQSKIPLIEKLKLQNLKNCVDMLVPMVVGVYICIILFNTNLQEYNSLQPKEVSISNNSGEGIDTVLNTNHLQIRK